MPKTKTTQGPCSLFGDENLSGRIRIGDGINKNRHECSICHKPLRKGRNCWYCENTAYKDEYGNVDVCPLWGQSVDIFSDSGEEGDKELYQNN